MTNFEENPNSSSFLTLKYSEVVRIYHNKSDAEVWDAFDKGDEMAFNYLYRTYMPFMFNYGYQISNHKEIVQDCIQNVFIHLRSRRGSLSKVSNIKGYLLKSLRREIIKKVKSKKNELFDIDAVEGSFIIEVSSETKMIEFESTNELKHKLEVALNQLTPKQRQAILLFYEEQLSYKQIAEIFDFSEIKTARKLLYRAINQLKNLLIKP